MARQEVVTHPCRWCGRQVYTRDKISTTGWVLILVGLLLAPVCIGLVLIPIGIFQKERFVACDKCGRQ